MKDENGSMRSLSPEEIALQQLEYTKKQYQMTRILAGLTAALLVVVIVASMMFYHRFNAIYKDLVVINANMKDITSDLADLDLKELNKHLVNTLEASETAMSAVSETISQVDIDELNRSIKSLQKALEPLVGILGVLGGGGRQ